MRKALGIILFAFLAAVSCRQPGSVELFVPGDAGPFAFSVDPTAVTGTSFPIRKCR